MNRKHTCMLFLLTISFVVPINAQESQIDPQAKEIIENFNQHLIESDAYSVKVHEQRVITINGEVQNYETRETILKQNDNRFAIVDDGAPTSTMVMNEDQVWITANMGNELKYIQHDTAPASVQALYDEQVNYEANFGVYTNFNIISLLISDDPIEAISEEATKITYEGKNDFQGSEKHQIKLTDDTLLIDLYFTTDELPQLVQAVINYDKNLTEMFKNHPDIDSISQIITLNFNEWNLSPELSKDDFVFAKTEGMKKVDTFQEQMMGQMGGPKALVGKVAPEIVVKTLAGKQFTLSEFKGKKPVVLNFWATFCPPCRAEMPDFQTVFNGQEDVEFLAVNLGDSEEKVQAFLKQMQLDLPIGMDTQGITAGPYAVSAIPQTVMINKDGVVEDVHIGLMTKGMMENVIKTLK